jgi:hypothetical protein
LGKVVKLESKHRAPAAQCTRLQSRNCRAREESALTPELKGFIDRVAAPILVEWYLSELQNEKQIAERAAGVASCELMTEFPEAEVAQ